MPYFIFKDLKIIKLYVWNGHDGDSENVNEFLLHLIIIIIIL